MQTPSAEDGTWLRTHLISSVNINVNMCQKMHVLYLDGDGYINLPML